MSPAEYERAARESRDRAIKRREEGTGESREQASKHWEQSTERRYRELRDRKD